MTRRGKSLASFGLSNLIADPTLELHNANGTLMILNGDWQSDPVSAAGLTVNGLALTDLKEAGIFNALASPVHRNRSRQERQDRHRLG